MLGLGFGLNKWRRLGGGYVGLLDLYPNAAAAYSLRKLRAAYSGSAVRVRKEVSTVSSETDIGFLADGSLDTTSLLAFASDADSGDVFVVTWYDQSLSNDATQSTAADQPKIVSGGSLVTEGSKPAVDFDGSNNDLDISLSITSGFSFFGVYKNTKDGSYLLGSSNAQFGRRGTSEYRFHVTGSFSANGGVHSNSQVLFTGIEDTTNATIYANGTQQAQGPSVFSSDTLTLISRLWILGNIQEVILYDSDQSTNRAAIETNINTFYSIYP